MRTLLALFFSFTFWSNAAATNCGETIPEKILLIKVDKTGQIAVGRDTVSSGDLAPYVQERLFKSYLGTGKMHDRIKIEKTDADVPDMVTEVVLKEIQEGQRRALTELCLQKHKKLFADLTTKQQEKLKKQYPVLFQTDFT
jgi:hypothetical protein